MAVKHIDVAEKDPVEILPYTFDWGQRWLEDGDVLRSANWAVPTGLTLGDGANGAPSPSFTDTLATAWFLGGTIGDLYSVSCTITAEPSVGGSTKTAKRTAGIRMIER